DKEKIMFKRFRLLAVLVLFMMICSNAAVAQEQTETILKGKVAQVAEDGSYIFIDETKLMISEDMKDYMNMEAGDEVEVTIEEVDGVKTVIEYEYVDL
ncbi:MAG: hypothetical protein L6416_09385, partial [Candidatus Omnitrophica bacterium]|nr:hypothetical protein [Candidatus Omnitrophota bacterium]